VPLQDAVIGAIAGYTSLWAIYWLFKLSTGKEGMGYGDFKLLAALGAWMGWQVLPVVILLSSVVGIVLAVLVMFLQKRGKDVPIPFGPYLAIAGWIALLWGTQLISWYSGLLSPTAT
jgi:leader peptidase (prepilin peptidase)/N-methyltransferase